MVRGELEFVHLHRRQLPLDARADRPPAGYVRDTPARERRHRRSGWLGPRGDARAPPMRVLVTCPPMLRRIDQFRAPFDQRGIALETPDVVQVLTEQQLLALVPRCDGWIIGDDPATRAVFAAGKAGALKAAVRWGVGVDNVDFAAARDLGIPVANTPGMFGREVADLAMAYVTALAREFVVIDRGVRAGGWPKPAGISLEGRTVALVGFGDIGRQTARRLLAADMKVTAYDPAIDAQALPQGVQSAVWPAGLE